MDASEIAYLLAAALIALGFLATVLDKKGPRT